MPRQREFDRDKVLREAMLLFRDQGYEVTSIQDLVDCMGINRFSLYATFKSKHDLFVAAIEAYYNRVVIPFFDRLKTSTEGLAIIERVLLELVTRIKNGKSPNGCLICNSIAELGPAADTRVVRTFERYLQHVEDCFRSAILRARDLGEVPTNVDASGHSKRLVAFSTGLLSLAKVMGEGELQESVRASVLAIR